MADSKTGKDVPVKLDKELKDEIERFISFKDNRFDFPSVKNFVDKAVLGLLKELEKKNGKKNSKKKV